MGASLHYVKGCQRTVFQHLQIRESLCVEIVTVTPGQVCISQTSEIVLDGNGFTNNLKVGQAICRFTTPKGNKTGKPQIFLSAPPRPAPPPSPSQAIILATSYVEADFFSLQL